MNQLSRFALSSVAALLFGTAPLLAQEGGSENTSPQQQEWDLTDLYPDAESWSREADRLEIEIDRLADYQGTLGDSPEALAAALSHASNTFKEVMRAFVYAYLKSDEDKRIAEHQERLSLAMVLYTDIGEATAWIAPEVLAVGEETIRAYVAAEPRLAEFDHYLDNILRNAEHTLGAEAESVLAATALVMGSPNTIYDTLTLANFVYPEITLSTGETVTLDESAYYKHIYSPVREDRKLVFDTYYGFWNSYRDTLGQILATEVNAGVTLARLRHYDSALEKALAVENLPTDVYETLVREVNAGLPTLHRYYRLRGEMLGIDDLRYYDTYTPIVQNDRVFDLETTRAITLEALAPLGEDYVDPMRAVTDSDWLHVYPQPGKATGAYMFGSAYDVHPYVLLNHNDDYQSLSTYAHELGHAVHTLLTNESQPFTKSDYATFIAEMASQINEILLDEYLLANAQTDEERLFYLGNQLDAMRGSFFRQTMFAEFEQAIHGEVEAGEALSGDRMNEIYLDLLRRYQGEAEGVMTIDDEYGIEWARIGHFYRDFYVYQYSTSIAGAAWFAEQLLAGNDQVRQDFIELLRAGGSDYPYELVKSAGLDMASPDPYRAAIRRMNDVMDRIEAILAARG